MTRSSIYCLLFVAFFFGAVFFFPFVAGFFLVAGFFVTFFFTYHAGEEDVRIYAYIYIYKHHYHYHEGISSYVPPSSPC